MPVLVAGGGRGSCSVKQGMMGWRGGALYGEVRGEAAGIWCLKVRGW